MTRLNVENLEWRALMSAVVVAAAAPPAAGAVVRVADRTAPQTNAFDGMQMDADIVTNDFTPPIGSNKGSFCGDGFGAVP